MEVLVKREWLTIAAPGALFQWAALAEAPPLLSGMGGRSTHAAVDGPSAAAGEGAAAADSASPQQGLLPFLEEVAMLEGLAAQGTQSVRWVRTSKYSSRCQLYMLSQSCSQTPLRTPFHEGLLSS